jgi:hypothetical protein
VLLNHDDSLFLAILEDCAHFKKNIVVHRIILSSRTRELILDGDGHAISDYPNYLNQLM